MRRRGYSGDGRGRDHMHGLDDVRHAWAGANAGIGGANGLIVYALLGVLLWSIIK